MRDCNGATMMGDLSRFRLIIIIIILLVFTLFYIIYNILW